MRPQKSLPERVFQALLYEGLAILIATPLFAWLLGHSLQAMAGVTVINCLLALAWNLLFNWQFDRWLARRGGRRTVAVRSAHALLFEGGLIAFSVPLIALWLEVSLWEALWLDIGVLLFFLPYTYLYHWAYDDLRSRFLRTSAQPPGGQPSN